MFNGFLAVIRSIILIVTLFILGNTMNRIVFERMREWGTLRALGDAGAEHPRPRRAGGLLPRARRIGPGHRPGLRGVELVNLCGGLPSERGPGCALHMIRLAPDLRAPSGSTSPRRGHGRPRLPLPGEAGPSA